MFPLLELFLKNNKMLMSSRRWTDNTMMVLPATGTWSSLFSSRSIDSVWTEQGRMWASGWVLCWRKERNETTDLVASQHEDELAEILLHVVELHLVFWCSHQGHSNRACGMKCNNHKLITIEYGCTDQYLPLQGRYYIFRMIYRYCTGPVKMKITMIDEMLHKE